MGNHSQVGSRKQKRQQMATRPAERARANGTQLLLREIHRAKMTPRELQRAQLIPRSSDPRIPREPDRAKIPRDPVTPEYHYAR